MNLELVLWIIYTPMLLALIPILYAFYLEIKDVPNEKKWNAYMSAYAKWDKNGKKGKMPLAEDFGYVNRYAVKNVVKQ